jgi:hypothetical protein
VSGPATKKPSSIVETSSAIYALTSPVSASSSSQEISTSVQNTQSTYNFPSHLAYLQRTELLALVLRLRAWLLSLQDKSRQSRRYRRVILIL